jgi:hypothetical protein
MIEVQLIRARDGKSIAWLISLVTKDAEDTGTVDLDIDAGVTEFFKEDRLEFVDTNHNAAMIVKLFYI